MLILRRSNSLMASKIHSPTCRFEACSCQNHESRGGASLQRGDQCTDHPPSAPNSGGQSRIMAAVMAAVRAAVRAALKLTNTMPMKAR